MTRASLDPPKMHFNFPPPPKKKEILQINCLSLKKKILQEQEQKLILYPIKLILIKYLHERNALLTKNLFLLARSSIKKFKIRKIPNRDN